MNFITLPRFVFAVALLLSLLGTGCVARSDYKYPYFGGGGNSHVAPRGSGVSRGI